MLIKQKPRILLMQSQRCRQQEFRVLEPSQGQGHPQWSWSEI